MATNFGFHPVLEGKRYFVSYKTEDTERVGRIARLLNQKGVPLWYDYGIPIGSKWKREISKNIKECVAFLIFITKNVFAHRSTYIKKEYDTAKYYNKRIIVIWLDDFRHHTKHGDGVNVHMPDWFEDISGLQGINVAGITPEEIVWKLVREYRLIHGYSPQPSTPINPYSEIKKYQEKDSGVGFALLFFLGLVMGGVFLYVSQSDASSSVDSDWVIVDGEVNHSYKLILGNASWSYAWNQCIEAGGYLARLETEDEYKQVAKKLETLDESGLWYIYLGGERDERDVYRWKSEDGQYLEDDLADSSLWYADYWYPGEPSLTDDDRGRTIEETCITLMKVDDKWYFNDSNKGMADAYPDISEDKIGYLIEFENVNHSELAGMDDLGIRLHDGSNITIIGNISVPANEFIFPESSYRLLTEEELNALKSESVERSYYQAQMAINEIFARYGYDFTSSSDTAKAMRKKYNGKEWYEKARELCPTNNSSELIENYMNDIEKENINLIVEWQNINGEEID